MEYTPTGLTVSRDVASSPQSGVCVAVTSAELYFEISPWIAIVTDQKQAETLSNFNEDDF